MTDYAVSRQPDGSLLVRFLVDDADGHGWGRTTIPPGAELFGVPYVSWEELAPGVLELRNGRILRSQFPQDYLEELQRLATGHKPSKAQT